MIDGNLTEAELVYVDNYVTSYEDTVYVPIYSDIYTQNKLTKFLLTATLSIRNTSLTESMVLNKVEYYDANGALTRHYLKRDLLLKPLQTIEYVIEEQDKEGGTGANFIIIWGAKTNRLKPIFQGVMISTHGQQGISFLTNGVSISNRKTPPVSNSSPPIPE